MPLLLLPTKGAGQLEPCIWSPCCDILQPQKGYFVFTSPERWSEVCLSQAVVRKGLKTPDEKEKES